MALPTIFPLKQVLKCYHYLLLENLSKLCMLSQNFSFTVAPDVNLGLGVYASRFAKSIVNSESTFINVPFGILTFGKRDKNISVGFGTFLFPNNGDKFSVLSISGELKLSKKISLMTENYILRSGIIPIPIISVGVRYVHKDYSLDAGLTAFRAPFLGFSVPFGRPK